MERLRVGILGATGMVGRQFVRLLAAHPWFKIVAVAASPASADRSYFEAVKDRWEQGVVPACVRDLQVQRVDEAVETIAAQADLVFCAVALDKDATATIEERYARSEVAVVSANSAHRWTPDVPMLIPEINPEHSRIIVDQRRRLGTEYGFVAVKPNCSIQPYMPALHALAEFEPQEVVVSTYQSLSGAGKTFASWPEMEDNVIPFIGGEEEKSEREPLRIWGTAAAGVIQPAKGPRISAQCVRVPVADGHLATVGVRFRRRPGRDEILSRWATFAGRPQRLGLPSAPTPFLRYCQDADRPQTRLDRDAGGGMAVSLGRLRDDSVFDYRFVALSHNTLRGAAGGCVLTAEMLYADGYITQRGE
jgi:aspartate-semialdehyde dehydrogenase